MRRRHRKARPVFADGIQFRSRLEARWATMLRLLKWGYTYEPPLDLRDYIADFAVLDGIAECKPYLRVTDPAFAEGATKVENSGYSGPVYMLGARTRVDDLGRTILGYTNLGNWAWVPFHLSREGGIWSPCVGSECHSTIPVKFRTGSIDAIVRRDDLNHRWVEYLWRQAGNETQWRRPASRG